VSSILQSFQPKILYAFLFVPMRAVCAALLVRIDKQSNCLSLHVAPSTMKSVGVFIKQIDTKQLSETVVVPETMQHQPSR
jgi:hypothetical protein